VLEKKKVFKQMAVKPGAMEHRTFLSSMGKVTTSKAHLLKKQA